MNVERATESMKVLLLFGLLMLCGIDVEPPAPGIEVALRDMATESCVQDVGCLQEEFWSHQP